MTYFYDGQQVRLKDEAIDLISSEILEDLEYMRGVTGVIKREDDPLNPQWDWVFYGDKNGGISVRDSEIEPVTP